LLRVQGYWPIAVLGSGQPIPTGRPGPPCNRHLSVYAESTARATSLPGHRGSFLPTDRRGRSHCPVGARRLTTRHAHPLPSLPLAAHRTNHARTGPQTATQNFLLTPPVTVHPTIPYYYGAVRTHPDCATPTPHQPTPAGQPAHEPHPAIRPRGERRAEPSCRNAGGGSGRPPKRSGTPEEAASRRML
jgi:hypothetical protein